MSVTVWDEWNEQGGPKYPHEKVVQFCFRTYPPEQRKHIRALDLGCGSGVHTVFLADEGFQVTGVDRSKKGIDNARRKLAERGVSANLRAEGADVLDFPPDSFDLIVCVGVFDCTGYAIAKASVECVRHILSHGGRGLFLFASDRDFRVRGENPLGLHGYTREEVERLFQHGFAKVWIDRYITTYQGGQCEQNDWLVTLER